MLNIAVIGSSGSGKSTLIQRICQGTIPLTGEDKNGVIRFHDVDVKLTEVKSGVLDSFDGIIVVVTLDSYEEADKIRKDHPNKKVVSVLSKQDLVAHGSPEDKLICSRLGGSSTILFSGLSLSNYLKVLGEVTHK